TGRSTVPNDASVAGVPCLPLLSRPAIVTTTMIRPATMSTPMMMTSATRGFILCTWALAACMVQSDPGFAMVASATARRYEITAAPADDGPRLDRLLAQRLPHLSRSRVKTLVIAGQVSADGATISDPSHRVKPGQEFTVIVPEARAAKPQGQSIALDIVYEDSDLIVVNKPA